MYFIWIAGILFYVSTVAEIDTICNLPVILLCIFHEQEIKSTTAIFGEQLNAIYTPQRDLPVAGEF